MADFEFTRTDVPFSLYTRAYEVRKDGVAIGKVVAHEASIISSIRGSRLVKHGRRRQFWTYLEPGQTMGNFWLKAETRSDAARFLVI